MERRVEFHSAGAIVRPGRSRDPWIYCATRLESTPNIGSEPAQGSHWRERDRTISRPDRSQAGAASSPVPDVPVPDVPVPDVIARDLDILLCGVNPGLRSAAVRHHFAHPGNRFWKLLHLAGLTDRVLAPEDERLLLTYGIGVTNLVERSTRSADEVSLAELRRGAQSLSEKVRRYRPANVVVLGISAYRCAFESPGALPGLQAGRFGPSRMWVLANPSGRQAHYRMNDMVEQLRRLKDRDVGEVPDSGAG